MEYLMAADEHIDHVFQIVQNTILTIYPKYYPREVVEFFIELHNRENIAKDMAVILCNVLRMKYHYYMIRLC